MNRLTLVPVYGAAAIVGGGLAYGLYRLVVLLF